MLYVIIKKRALLIAGLTAVMFAAAAMAVYSEGAQAVYLGQTVRKLPIYCVDTEEKKVAISFDAAWGAEKTQGLIDTLTEHEAKATFFLVGFWTRKYPELVKKIDAAGFEIGTHSNTHPHMPKLSASKMELELTASMAAITEVTGKDVTLFRAPFGDYSDKMLTVCEGLKLKTIQWDVDSLDWKNLTAGEMTQRVMSRVKPGSIMLFHNDGMYTPDALPAILVGLKNKGYKVVSIGELLHKGEYTIDHTGKMMRK